MRGLKQDYQDWKIRLRELQGAQAECWAFALAEEVGLDVEEAHAEEMDVDVEEDFQILAKLPEGKTITLTVKNEDQILVLK